MLKTRMKIAVVQMSAGADKDANMDKAEGLAHRAAASGAKAILFPECFLYRGPAAAVRAQAEKLNGPSVKRFQDVARETDADILMGSMYEKAAGEKKVYNTSIFIRRDGMVSGVYRKRNLFEARLSRKTIRESDIFLAGKKETLIPVRGFSAGLAVCYDLRFPKLFGSYAGKGCELFFVPSNFTEETGRAHWEVLLRARAIENRCYVFAPNQHGASAGGVRAYGNSMIIDPWGRVLERAGGAADKVLLAEIDKKEIAKARQRLP